MEQLKKYLSTFIYLEFGNHYPDPDAWHLKGREQEGVWGPVGLQHTR